jgi:hypothetical protein
MLKSILFTSFLGLIVSNQVALRDEPVAEFNIDAHDVRKEALRRIAQHDYEKRVKYEMRRIRAEENYARSEHKYREWHRFRKERLANAYERGALRKSIFVIESAISDYACGETSEDDLYQLISAVDDDYAHRYANSRQGKSLETDVDGMKMMYGRETEGVYHGQPLNRAYTIKSRHGIPHTFIMYLDAARGILFTYNKKEYFNQYTSVPF